MNRFIWCCVATLMMPAAIALADQKQLEGKAAPVTAGASIDFAKQLGVQSPSLIEFGARIDTARYAADPIGLAALASELAALEKATGKTADLKADALAAEAIEMAKERNLSGELKIVAALLPDQAAAANLSQLADAALKSEAAAAADQKNGAKARGINGTLTVNNQTTVTMRILCNGFILGDVPAGGSAQFVLNDGNRTTTLYAIGGPTMITLVVAAPSEGGTWTLSPPSQ